MTAAIEARSLRKVYGDLVAVDDVSFIVEPGEIFGILGPNGAGKTTTLEMVEGLREPDGGESLILGAAHLATQRGRAATGRRAAAGVGVLRAAHRS